MLVNGIFSFSHNIFTHSTTKIVISATFIFSSANAFNLVTSKILSFGKEFTTLTLNSPNNKILDVTKLKAFADDKSNVAEMKISLNDRVANTVGKGENAGTSIFSFSHSVFQSLLL